MKPTSRLRPPPNQPRLCRLTLEYTYQKEVSALDRPIYVTAVENPIRTWFRSLHARRSLFIQKRLTGLETLELQPFFSALASLLRKQHEELRSEPVAIAGSQNLKLQWTATANATITPVPAQNRANIVIGKHLLMSNLVALTPVGLFALGGGLIYLAYLVHGTLGIPLAVTVGIVGALPILAGIYIGLCCAHNPERIYAQAVLRKNFAKRADRVVEPGAIDVFHVALTVRENWQKVKLETATDAGFAIIDEERRELRMECDSERFLIPAASILVCKSEFLTLAIDPQSEFWMTRLLVQLPEGTREILLSNTTPSWNRQTNLVRKESALCITGQISFMVSETT